MIEEKLPEYIGPAKKIRDIPVPDQDPKVDPNTVPLAIGEDGEGPLTLKLMLLTPEEREEKAKIEQEEKIPFFARKPKDFPLHSYKKVLTYKYNWYPVCYSLCFPQ